MTPTPRTFLITAVLFVFLPALPGQTLLKDTGRQMGKGVKALGRVSGAGAKKAGLATRSGGRKAAHFSAQKLNKGAAKLEEKTR